MREQRHGSRDEPHRRRAEKCRRQVERKELDARRQPAHGQCEEGVERLGDRGVPIPAHRLCQRGQSAYGGGAAGGDEVEDEHRRGHQPRQALLHETHFHFELLFHVFRRGELKRTARGETSSKVKAQSSRQAPSSKPQISMTHRTSPLEALDLKLPLSFGL